ncbi:hypothetical protein ISF6_4976 [Piscinibacter sakaiensis]|uniref:Translocation and assembly module TamB C-terminal domain-containing protein n=1 Tax=Piscinibacter sakaiensis TaxID=1547922 RepID=A0A0K8P779_PISS1|nr:hypothetical protein ISF6_4976 [Piscinibacter sakaiensis]
MVGGTLGGLLLALLVLLPVALVLGLRSEGGSAWLLQRLPGVEAVAPRGALLGDFSAQRLEIGFGAGGRVTLERPSWQGFALTPTPGRGPWATLRLDRLAADRLTLVLPPSPPSSGPPQAPASLRLPVALDIASLQLGELRAEALGAQPLRGLAARLSLGADGGQQHRLWLESLAWDRLSASGELQIGSDAPLPLQSRLALVPVGPATAAAAAPAASASASASTTPAPATSPAPAPAPAFDPLRDWQAELRLQGPLERLRVQARVTPTAAAPAAAASAGGASPAAPRTAPSAAAPAAAADRPALLDADAVLQPFQPWPLAELQARAHGLDLAAFSSAAPMTRLSGAAQVRSVAADQPALVELSVDNAAAGRWNEGRLPVHALRVALSARPDRPEVLEVRTLEAELGTRRQPAGRLLGEGRLDGARWRVDARLENLDPGGLDARAAAMRVSGRLSASGGPTEADAAGAGASAASAAPAAPAAPAASAVTDERWIRVSGRLEGRLDAGRGPTPASRATPAAGRRSTDATPRRAARAPATARTAAASATAASPGRASATRGQPVQLDIDAQLRLGPGGALALDARRLEARAGEARARLEGRLRRAAADADWQVDTRGELQAFDPRPWWSGPTDSPWRAGPHRLNAQWQAALRYDPAAVAPAPAPGRRPPATATATATTTTTTTPPAADPTGAGLAALAPLRGQAELTLRPSVLAGVALEGQARLGSTGRAPATEVRVDLALQAAGNRLQAEARLRSDRPAEDRVELRLDAPALAALAPVAALAGWAPTAPREGGRTAAGAAGSGAGAGRAAAGADSAGSGARAAALAGRLQARAGLQGRWPRISTTGELRADGLRLAGNALQRGELRWTLGTAADAPADLQARLDGAAFGTTVAEQLTVSLSGTARAHRLQLEARGGGSSNAAAASPAPAAAPPAAGAASAASPATASSAGATPGGPATLDPARPIAPAAQRPLTATLQGRGGLVFAGGGGLLTATGWRGQLQTLDVRSGSGADALGALSRDLEAEVDWPADGPARARLAPGRVELQAGPSRAALRWSRLAWQAGTPAGAGAAAPPAGIEAEATLEPLAVAPLLARLQPEFGWGGDLQIAGSLSLRSAPRPRAEVVIERRSGDLGVTDEFGTQRLGLSDLRLGLSAADGVWSFTQALAGSAVGVAAGAVVARTGSPTAWPDAATPIEGVVELRVAQLGTWATWIPTGWRLGGALHVSAGIGGRLGAPEITGALRGTDVSVRNFAEGVNVTEGQVAITLQGSTARVERFTARAGPGTLEIGGGASFGADPELTLTVQAKRFQLLGRVDRRIVASGDGRLRAGTNRVAFDGRFVVDEGLIDFTRGDAPSLSDDVVVVRAPPASREARTQEEAERRAGAAASRLGSESRTRPDGGATARPVAAAAAPRATAVVDLRVDLGRQLRLRGRGLDTGLRGELHITSPNRRLSVNGTVSTDGGTYQAYGQKLTVDRGAVIFSGPIDNPRLDIEATRPNTDVRVGVIVAGTAANPRIRLFSEPDLPEVDKLSWLVLGRATEGLGRTDTALLQRAALALLSGEGEGMSDRVTRLIGLDDLSVRQSDDDARETVIAVGKQISQRWYVGYERGLNATAGSWQLIYRIAQRLTLRAQSGLINSVDVVWTFRWQ